MTPGTSGQNKCMRQRFARTDGSMSRPTPGAAERRPVLATSQVDGSDFFEMPGPNDWPKATGAAGLGGVAGYCSGVTLKSIGRVTAFVGGSAFVGLTMMERSGYLTVNWKRIERDLTLALDTNDDGVIDEKDLQGLAIGSVKYLTQHTAIPAGAFVAGFALGFRT